MESKKIFNLKENSFLPKLKSSVFSTKVLLPVGLASGYALLSFLGCETPTRLIDSVNPLRVGMSFFVKKSSLALSKMGNTFSLLASLSLANRLIPLIKSKDLTYFDNKFCGVDTFFEGKDDIERISQEWQNLFDQNKDDLSGDTISRQIKIFLNCDSSLISEENILSREKNILNKIVRDLEKNKRSLELYKQFCKPVFLRYLDEDYNTIRALVLAIDDDKENLEKIEKLTTEKDKSDKFKNFLLEKKKRYDVFLASLDERVIRSHFEDSIIKDSFFDSLFTSLVFLKAYLYHKIPGFALKDERESFNKFFKSDLGQVIGIKHVVFNPVALTTAVALVLLGLYRVLPETFCTIYSNFVERNFIDSVDIKGIAFLTSIFFCDYVQSILMRRDLFNYLYKLQKSYEKSLKNQEKRGEMSEVSDASSSALRPRKQGGDNNMVHSYLRIPALPEQNPYYQDES